MNKNISIIIPSYNESENIEILYNRTKKILMELSIEEYELIFIDNGSTDNSLKILKNINKKDNSVKILSLTRNFGLQNALYAGLSHCKKDYICVMDGDLQDPPELIKNFFTKIDDGYDVVYGIRKKRQSNAFKKICYKIFYYFFSNFSEIEMPSQVGEFCLMKRKVLNKILEFKEKNLFIRGLRAWVGFKQTGVEYDRPKRNAGTEKFNLFSSFFFGLDGLISFSIIPLRIILLTGLFMSFISILFSFFIFIVKLLSILSIIPSDALLLMPKGLTITSILFLISTSFIILALGIIGEYISKIYLEVKNRPHYLIKEIIE